ncbi:hypothetical protein ON058_02835 [Demequina sp. B12]|uniref:hypothetical protein n=1 Tax=Demequina sp. B12 TaxID=2992757 RepID=UPI00237A12D6|nr:hypothetical protein [Demequina sp. B12]MDE0572346.1 hypothetical protein [Demequina sp. B12]
MIAGRTGVAVVGAFALAFAVAGPGHAEPHVIPAHATSATDPPQDPMLIEVPYLDGTQVTVNPAWTLTECPTVDLDRPLSIECDDSGQISVSTDYYDPAFGSVPFPVQVTTSDGSPRTLPYLLGLAAPEPAEPIDAQLPYPALAGGRTLIPLADLVVSCTYCVNGFTVDVEGIEGDTGAPAPTVYVAAHHLVIDAPTQEATTTISLAITDGSGNPGEPSELTVPLVTRTDATATALHWLSPATASGPMNAQDLVADPEGAIWAITSCTSGVTGTATCSPTELTYAAADAAEPLADQVTVTLTSASGRVVVSSVTFVPDLDAPALASAAPATNELSPIATPQPPTTRTGAAGADSGILTPLWAALSPSTPKETP